MPLYWMGQWWGEQLYSPLNHLCTCKITTMRLLLTIAMFSHPTTTKAKFMFVEYNGVNYVVQKRVISKETFMLLSTNQERLQDGTYIIYHISMNENIIKPRLEFFLCYFISYEYSVAPLNTWWYWTNKWYTSTAAGKPSDGNGWDMFYPEACLSS